MNKRMISKEVVIQDGKHYVEEKYWSLFPSDRIITTRRRKLFSISTMLDLLPKWTSIVVWVMILISMGMMNRVNGQVSTYGEFLSEKPVEIVAYQLVESYEMGCWSELRVINMKNYKSDVRDKIKKKIINIELYQDNVPILEIKDKSGRVSYYHFVKLPNDSYGRSL